MLPWVGLSLKGARVNVRFARESQGMQAADILGVMYGGHSNSMHHPYGCYQDFETKELHFNSENGAVNKDAGVVCQQRFSFSVTRPSRSPEVPPFLAGAQQGITQSFGNGRKDSLKGNHRGWCTWVIPSSAENQQVLFCSDILSALADPSEVVDPRLTYTLSTLRFSQDGNAVLFSIMDSEALGQECDMAYGRQWCKERGL